MRLRKKRLKTISVCLIVASFVTSCVTLDYVVTPPSEAELSAARSEIYYKGEMRRNNLSLDQNFARLQRVEERLRPVARSLCMALGDRRANECSFDLLYDEDESFNAYATNSDGKNIIVIHIGVLRQTHSDDELAFVVAHEIAHHITDHISEQSGFTVGEAVGLILGAAVLSESGGGVDPDKAGDFLYNSMAIGGAFDRPKFNRAQESEADLIAMKMILSAGYDDKKARNVLVNMASISNSTGFFESHPSGEARVALASTFRSEPAFIEIAAIQSIALCGRSNCDTQIIDPTETLIASAANSSGSGFSATFDVEKMPDAIADTKSDARNTAFASGLPKDDHGQVSMRTARSSIVKKYSGRFLGSPTLVGGSRKNFFASSFPIKKIGNFTKKAKLSSDIDILGFYDGTSNGGGKNGILFTYEGIYINMLWSKTIFLTYSDLSNRGPFRASGGTLDLGELVPGGVYILGGNLYHGTMNNDAETMGQLLFELANLE